MKKLGFILATLCAYAGSNFTPMYAMQNVPVTQVVNSKSWTAGCVIGALWLGWTFAPLAKFFLETPSKENMLKNMLKEASREKDLFFFPDQKDPKEDVLKKMLEDIAPKMGLQGKNIGVRANYSEFMNKLTAFVALDIEKWKKEKSFSLPKLFSNYATVVIHRGMIDTKEPSKELFFTMAHELAHIKNNDPISKAKSYVTAVAVRGLCGAFFLPLIYHSNISVGAKGLLMFQGFAGLDSLINSVQDFHWRQKEKRADLTAIQVTGDKETAVKYFDDVRMSYVLARSHCPDDVDDQGNFLLDTEHPPLTERIAYCQAAIPLKRV